MNVYSDLRRLVGSNLESLSNVPRTYMQCIEALRFDPCDLHRLVGSSGLEPPTSRLSGARSNHLSYEPIQFFRCVSRLLSLIGISTDGGDDGNRTHDPLLAGQVLSQLSYTPIWWGIYLSALRSLKIEQQQTYTHKALRTLSPSVKSIIFLVFVYF